MFPFVYRDLNNYMYLSPITEYHIMFNTFWASFDFKQQHSYLKTGLWKVSGHVYVWLGSRFKPLFL